jgi:hypothetical protein
MASSNEEERSESETSSMSGSQRERRQWSSLYTESSRNISESDVSSAAKRRWSTLGLRIRASSILKSNLIQAKLHEHCDIEYNPEECEITQKRLDQARKNVVQHRTSCTLCEEEKDMLVKEQQCIKSLLTTGSFDDEEEDDLGFNGILESLEEEEEEEDEEEKDEIVEQQTKEGNEQLQINKCQPLPQARRERSASTKTALGNIKAKLIKLKLRSRLDKSNDGVLGVQAEQEEEDDDYDYEDNDQIDKSLLMMDASISSSTRHRSSIILPPTYRRSSKRSTRFRGSDVDEKFVKYNMNMKLAGVVEEEEEEKEMDVECVDYVRKPNLATILEQYDAMTNHPKYS